MERLKRYTKIYSMLLKLNFSSLIAYRSNFIHNLFASSVWAAFSIISIELMTARTPRVYGWSRDEILLLTGVYNIIVGVFYMLFSRNFQKFSNIVHMGKLDSILTKPIDPLFFLTCYYFNYTSILRVIVGIAFSIHIVLRMHIPVTLFTYINFTVLMMVSLVLLYSIWCLVISLTIKYSRLSNLVDVLYTVNGVSRYPPKMLQGLKSQFVIFLLPLTLLIATPSLVLIHKALAGDIWMLIASAIFFLVLSRMFFSYMLRYYTSASG